jgi:hypothetical protein
MNERRKVGSLWPKEHSFFSFTQENEQKEFHVRVNHWICSRKSKSILDSFCPVVWKFNVNCVLTMSYDDEEFVQPWEGEFSIQESSGCVFLNCCNLWIDQDFLRFLVMMMMLSRKETSQRSWRLELWSFSSQTWQNFSAKRNGLIKKRNWCYVFCLPQLHGIIMSKMMMISSFSPF